MHGSSDGHLAIGQVVERYRITGTLGIGATGVVYAVRHTTLGVDRAMKVVNAAAPRLAERLVREGTVIGQVNHPNVVAIHDVVEFTDSHGNTRPALILDRVDGPTLDDFLRQAHPDRHDAVTLWTGIVSGVAAAHAAGIVHRDLKPANVLLDTQTSPPTPRVADFGVATSTPGVRSHLSGAGFMGTFGYAAPEQLGQQGTAGPASDVFSLGIVGYELLTGRHPFEHKDPSAMVRAMRCGDFDIPQFFLNERAGNAVIQCLDPDPTARPHDANAVLALLAAPNTTPIQTSTPPKGRPVATAAITAMGVAVAAALVVANNDVYQRLEAVQHDLLAEQAHGNPSVAIAHARAAAALHGHDDLDPRWLARRVYEGGAAWHFPPAPTPYTSVVAANTTLVAASADGDVITWDTATGAQLGAFPLGMRVPTNAKSNLEGTWLIVGPDMYLGGSDSPVVVRSLPDGRPLASVADPVSVVAGAMDGERACVTTINGDSHAQLTVLAAPDWGVDRHTNTTRTPPNAQIAPWARCGDDYWLYPADDGVQVEFFDGSSHFYDDVNAFNATATHQGLYVPEDGAVRYIGIDGEEQRFRPSEEALELYDSVSDEGLFVGRTTTSGWSIHGPSGRVSHIPGLVRWGPGTTVPLIAGLRDGTVQRHDGDRVTSYSGIHGRVLSVSESMTGLLAASGLGGGASAWPATRTVTGEMSRLQATNGSWLGASTDVVWADGNRVVRTAQGDVEELAVLAEEVLLVRGNHGTGVAVLGRTGLYGITDHGVIDSGSHAGRVWPRASPVMLGDQLVEVTSLGLLIHKGQQEFLRTLDQLEVVEPSPSGDMLWLATGRDETAVLSRMDQTLTSTPLSHDVQDAVGVSFMAPQLDGGALVGTWSGHTLVWKGDAPVVHKVLGPIAGPVNAIDRHNNRFAVGGWSGTVHVFDGETLAWSAEVGERISSVAWAPQGDFLAVGDDTGALVVFDANGRQLSVRQAHTHPIDVRWEDSIGPATLDTLGLYIRWDAEQLVNPLSPLQASGALTNMRICQHSKRAVPVLPYPSADTIWAPAHLCRRSESP